MDPIYIALQLPLAMATVARSYAVCPLSVPGCRSLAHVMCARARSLARSLTRRGCICAIIWI